MTRDARRTAARTFLRRRRPVPVAGVYDCLSALLAERAGFEALYLSGGALSVSRLGRPDVGLLTLDDVADAARRIADCTRRPLFVDIDTGFGGPQNAARAVRTLESAGVSGVQIEDQAFPKRCGHLSGKSLIPAEEMVAKLRAAVAARSGPAFLIIARTDARAVEGVDAALERARLYKKAGADVIFPEALESRSEFGRFGTEKSLGSLMANMTEYGRSPALTASALARLGFRFILFPMTAFRSAAFAMDDCLKRLKTKGQSASFLSRLQPRSDLYRLIGYSETERTERQWRSQAERIVAGKRYRKTRDS